MIIGARTATVNLLIIQHNLATNNTMHAFYKFSVELSLPCCFKSSYIDLVPLMFREIAVAHIERPESGLAG